MRKILGLSHSAGARMAAAIILPGAVGTHAQLIEGGASEALQQAQGYVIVVSEATASGRAWGAGVRALKDRRSARVVMYRNDLSEVVGELRGAPPRYIGIVAQPGECTAEFAAEAHRLVRRIDDDPYADAQWGIITGHEGTDVERMAATPEALIAKTALTTTGIATRLYESCCWISDGRAGDYGIHKADGTVIRPGEAELSTPSDLVGLFAEQWSALKPDVIITSSHGFQGAVEMPFGRGRIVSRNGRLYSRAMGQSEDAPLAELDGARVFLPVGNCLVGRIDGPDCMIPAMIHSAGVKQAAAYTVEKWYGRAGWGTLQLWTESAGRLTLSEAFLLNQHIIMSDLLATSPGAAEFEPPIQGSIDMEAFSLAVGAAGLNAADRDVLGLLWDRDSFVFYGDPAWECRLNGDRLARGKAGGEGGEAGERVVVEWTGDAVDGLKINIESDRAGGDGWIAALLPRRFAGVVEAPAQVRTILGDDFVLVGRKGLPSGRVEIRVGKSPSMMLVP